LENLGKFLTFVTWDETHNLVHHLFSLLLDDGCCRISAPVLFSLSGRILLAASRIIVWLVSGQLLIGPVNFQVPQPKKNPPSLIKLLRWFAQSQHERYYDGSQ